MKRLFSRVCCSFDDSVTICNRVFFVFFLSNTLTKIGLIVIDLLWVNLWILVLTVGKSMGKYSVFYLHGF